MGARCGKNRLPENEAPSSLTAYYIVLEVAPNAVSCFGFYTLEPLLQLPLFRSQRKLLCQMAQPTLRQ